MTGTIRPAEESIYRLIWCFPLWISRVTRGFSQVLLQVTKIYTLSYEISIIEFGQGFTVSCKPSLKTSIESAFYHAFQAYVRNTDSSFFKYSLT